MLQRWQFKEAHCFETDIRWGELKLTDLDTVSVVLDNCDYVVVNGHELWDFAPLRDLPEK